jgi:hypothetical protein
VATLAAVILKFVFVIAFLVAIAFILGEVAAAAGGGLAAILIKFVLIVAVTVTIAWAYRDREGRS